MISAEFAAKNTLPRRNSVVSVLPYGSVSVCIALLFMRTVLCATAVPLRYAHLMGFTIRKASLDDVPEIERVMRESITGLGRRTYDEREIASSLQHVAHIDRHLIRDGTYFVVEEHGAIIGCGGWSRRGKLYAGSSAQADEDRFLDPATEAARVRAMFVVPSCARRGIGRAILERCESEARASGFREVELMAMLSGRELYLACGYVPLENVAPELADGTPLPLTRMKKLIV